MEKISVIIPMYNIEKYILKCLTSIQNQTYSNIEVLCIDDGSTDNTASRVKDFISQNPQFTLTQTENRGLSNARNTGIELSSGTYISFIDGDDWIEADFLEKLHNRIKQSGADITYCLSACHIGKKDRKFTFKYFNSTPIPETSDEYGFHWSDYPQYFYKICVLCTNKLYRRQLLEENNITFLAEYIHEDNLFHFQTFIAAKKISIVREELHHYRRTRPGSITSASNLTKYLKMEKIRREFMKNASVYKQLKTQHFTSVKENIKFYLNRCHLLRFKKEYYNLQKSILALIDSNDIILKDFDKKTKNFYMKIINNSYLKFILNQIHSRIRNSKMHKYY